LISIEVPFTPDPTAGSDLTSTFDVKLTGGEGAAFRSPARRPRGSRWAARSCSSAEQRPSA